MPQRHTSAVANRKLVAKGAKDMAPANIKCPIIHAVSKLGFTLLKRVKKPAMAWGGR